MVYDLLCLFFLHYNSQIVFFLKFSISLENYIFKYTAQKHIYMISHNVKLFTLQMNYFKKS